MAEALLKLLSILLLLACCGAALAQDAGYAVRSTELKAEPFSDSAGAGTLPERTQVRIVSRQGGWLKVESAAAGGWVRLLAIRTGSSEQAGGDSGLKQLLNVARSGSSGTAVATGVRGLDREQIQNAQPNPAELDKMARFAASRSDAEQFATGARIAEQAIDYLPAPAAAAPPTSVNP